MTEDKPHVVYPKDGSGPEIVRSTYHEAYKVWAWRTSPDRPWLIRSPTGRVIDPAQPIIDVNE